MGDWSKGGGDVEAIGMLGELLMMSDAADVVTEGEKMHRHDDDSE